MEIVNIVKQNRQKFTLDALDDASCDSNSDYKMWSQGISKNQWPPRPKIGFLIIFMALHVEKWDEMQKWHELRILFDVKGALQSL